MAGPGQTAVDRIAALRSNVLVFMFHHFAPDAPTLPALVDTCTTSQLDRYLSAFARHGWKFDSLNAVIDALEQGAESSPTVVMTVDDGYADFVEHGAPVFARHECPVTLFATTGFVDGDLWFWWDRIDHALTHSARAEVTLELSLGTWAGAWSNASERLATAVDLVELLKGVPNEELLAAVVELADRLEVELPARPPEIFAPASWADLRRLEQDGVDVGPHTVSHPILSKLDAAQAQAEIEGSWTRIQAEIRRTASVICYPNGDAASFGPREITIARSAGLRAGVTAQPGLPDRAFFRPGDDRRYGVPRFNHDGRLVELARARHAFRLTLDAYVLARSARNAVRRLMPARSSD